MTGNDGEEVVDEGNGLVLRRVAVGPLDTNCWSVHFVGSSEALLIDPGDEPARILDAVSDLRPAAIVLTHAHFDHVLAVPDIVDALGIPVLAHPADAAVWPNELAHLARHGHFDAGTATVELLASRPGSLAMPPGRRTWDGRSRPLADGQRLSLGPEVVTVLHTPGHTPGGLTLAAPGHLFTGDTLFPGGPGLTGWPLSSFPTIMTSVRRLLAEPVAAVIHPGHGPDTTVGAERPSVESWQRRGW